MQLENVLFTQGFGTRRDCRDLIRSGRVQWKNEAVLDPFLEVDPAGRSFLVDGQDWPWVEKALVVLHKPAGWECSQKPTHHPSVMQLLPPPLRRRGVQPVGRLDADTTGLLLLTDDGALSHRLTHPKRHVTKTYEALCRHAPDEALCAKLTEGVVLKDDPRPCRAVSCRLLGENRIELVIDSGSYHQVRRMVAAAGNRVEALHRSKVGAYRLPADLEPGRWTWLFDAAPLFVREAA